MAQSATDFPGFSGGPIAASDPEGPTGVRARSPRQIFWERFKDDKLAIVGACMVVFMIVTALLAPFFENLVGHPYTEQYRRQMLNEFGTPLGPNSEFWFGADKLGRDLFVRVFYGARVSLTIAIVATGIEIVIGVIVGMLAGFFKGWVDTLISRVIDLTLSIPALLLGISLGVIFPEAGLPLVVGIIAFFGWPYIARIVRGQTLSLREAQFVEAAYSLGATPRWIMAKEILPNLIAPIVIYSTLIVPINIVFEASLSFLGVGVKPPEASWGEMLSSAVAYVSYGEAWWYMFWPGLALFITVLGFNLLGDGLRDALDPKTAR
ncbi:MAG TPA: ABC transporter permease [Actinomycetota bacterium]|nr:ABC transporter permease [Actinomycetota bacterium]